MSAQIVLFPRGTEAVAKTIWKWTARGYCLTNVAGSKFIHIRPQVPVLRDIVKHPTIQWLQELEK